MKNIVLITGDLAAGKSTLADKLSSTLGITCIKKDCVKEIICDGVDFTTREENRRISVATVNSMIHFLEQTLKIGGDLILEANFRLSEINQIKEVIEKYGAKLSIVFLYGDYEVLFKRFVSRLPTRHKAHLSQGLDKDYEKYVSVLTDFRNQLEGIKCLKVDTTLLNEEMVLDEVVSYLNR